MSLSNLEVVQSSGLVDQTIKTLREAIVAGTWGVGERIPVEGELAERLGVGRNTVREAVRALVHAGMLQTRQGRGTFVIRSDELGSALARALREEDLRDIIEVRRALEAEAAGLTAMRRTAADLKRIKTALRRGLDAVAVGDIEAFVIADSAFHLAVAEASGNRVLARIYAELIGTIREYVHIMQTATTDHTALDWHQQLVDAIGRKDAEAARVAAVAHLDVSRVSSRRAAVTS